MGADDPNFGRGSRFEEHLLFQMNQGNKNLNTAVFRFLPASGIVKTMTNCPTNFRFWAKQSGCPVWPMSRELISGKEVMHLLNRIIGVRIRVTQPTLT